MKMWKEVVAVKRVFKEMSSATKMELGKIRCEISGTTREVSGACSGVSANMKNASKIDVSLELFGWHFNRVLNILISGSSTSAARTRLGRLEVSDFGNENSARRRPQ